MSANFRPKRTSFITWAWARFIPYPRYGLGIGDLLDAVYEYFPGKRKRNRMRMLSMLLLSG